ncbi:uncharacterized protein METZ01_LOCUS192776 [marine metagenome]|uniref:Glycine-rich domain-containing protein n=1 Tax=marine metagenome TaxID=408172 RepID=A0A382DPD6_9ZZZZ
MGLTVVPGTMIEDGTITDSNFPNTEITSADMALDPRDADNFSSGSVPLAQLDNVPATDLTGLDDDLALLGFKTAANGSLAKYNLLDQTVDAFEDASGVDASASTGEDRDSTGKYFQGAITTRTTHTASGTYITPAGLLGTIEVLVVAGGGAGSGGGAGGAAGGAGGLVYVSAYTAAASTTYNLTIGAGGAAQGAGTSGNSGADSIFDTSGTSTTLTASGGGGGGEGGTTGKVGGSGGGGYSTSGANAGGASDQVASFGSYSNVGFGFAGGQAYTSGSPYGGGGGGGAGAVGLQGKPQGEGTGGIGKAYTIADGTTSVYYAGGGGGGTIDNTTPGRPGGLGGGGTGGFGLSSVTDPTAGTANTGGGGGGGRNDGGGAAGGSGVIITSHKAPTNMTLVSTATAAQAAPTKGDIVFTYSNGAGTAVINTNITAEISADNGSTWTAFTLTSQGTTGGHTILTSHNQTITSTITAPYNMKYRIKTLVQGSSMNTRIQAVSLGWS